MLGGGGMMDEREREFERLKDEARVLSERLEQAREMPDMASQALRKARARIDELRVSFGTAVDELSRARALLIETWRSLKALEFCMPTDPPACPACGGSGWHAEACPLGRALDLGRDPRSRRSDLEDAIDRAWRQRSGETEGVKARQAFMDEVFSELSRRGLIRED